MNITRISSACAVFTAIFIAVPVMADMPQQITQGFVDGIEVCLEASLRGVSVGNLPPEILNRVTKGDERARFMVAGRNAQGPIWAVKTAPGNVLISEAADGDCEVAAFGPPVDKTLKQAQKAVLKREATFQDAGDAPDDYTPIRYGLIREADGTRVHVVLEGAEPGTVPGRFSRFSLLSARLTRTVVK